MKHFLSRAFLIVAVIISCISCSNVESQFVGKWQKTADPTRTVEFFKNGKFIGHSEEATYKGNWHIYDGKLWTEYLSTDGVKLARPTQSAKFEFNDTDLIISDRNINIAPSILRKIK